MRALKAVVGTAVVGLAAGLLTAPVATAERNWALNGSYRVISNGDWAKTNEVLMKEAVVVENWTFNTSCTTAQACNGMVNSSGGWSAPAEFRGTRWIVDRYHPDWQTCPDGTKSPGRQRYQFHGLTATGGVDRFNTDFLQGYNRTIGTSGACGRNTPTVISIPLRLERI